MPLTRLIFAPLVLLLGLGALVATPSARAEAADRNQPIVIEADRPSTLNLGNQVVVFQGNVQITQGTLRIGADRVEIRDHPDGSRTAVATGSGEHRATYRQKREGLNETVEGAADRIEYDSKSGTLRLIGNASIRRLRDGVVADQISGAHITWDDKAELFSVRGDEASDGGRVRAVLAPRSAAPDASASAPASAPASGTKP